MKWDCGETLDEKEVRFGAWHKWFAWHPIKVADHDCRWLVWIERQGKREYTWDDWWWVWKYRE